MKVKNKGKIIVIEGLDGSGKSTQWEMLRKMLKSAMNTSAMFVTFPDYDSESGKIISRYLSGEFGEQNCNNAYSASSFYAIDRYISYKTSWGEHYENGTNIISARYTSSNAIYQMTKLPESQWEGFLDWLCDYEHVKLGIPEPDLTIFLDVPVKISQELLSKRYNGEDSKDIHEGSPEYLEKCRKAAMYVAEKSGWVIVDCMDSTTGELRERNDIQAELVKIIGKFSEETL